MPEYEYIEKIEKINTGGNFMIDLIHLKNGKVFAVSIYTVTLYPSFEAFKNSEEIDFISMR